MMGVGLECEHVCFCEGIAAGHLVRGTPVNAEHCKEIYDGLQTPKIKHNAKRKSAALNQTQSPSSFSASYHFPPAVSQPHQDICLPR